MEEHVVDDAEDDRGGADTESQGEDGDEGETKILAEIVEGTAEVARQTIHVGLHTSKLYTEAAANCRDLTMDDNGRYPWRQTVKNLAIFLASKTQVCGKFRVQLRPKLRVLIGISWVGSP